MLPVLIKIRHVVTKYEKFESGCNEIKKRHEPTLKLMETGDWLQSYFNVYVDLIIKYHFSSNISCYITTFSLK